MAANIYDECQARPCSYTCQRCPEYGLQCTFVIELLQAYVERDLHINEPMFNLLYLKTQGVNPLSCEESSPASLAYTCRFFETQVEQSFSDGHVSSAYHPLSRLLNHSFP